MAKLDEYIGKEKQALWKAQKNAIDVARKRLALMDLEFTDVKYPDEPSQQYLCGQAKLIVDILVENYKL